MNECVVVKVGVRLVREITFSEMFLTLQPSDCTIASCKTIQDEEGRKIVVIGVEGTNASIRAKNLPSPQETSSTSRLGGGSNPVYSGGSPKRYLLTLKDGSKGEEARRNGNGLWRSLLGFLVMISFPLKWKNI